MYDAGSSTQCSVTTWRGGMGWEVGGRFKKEGTYVYLWLIHGDVWQKRAMSTLTETKCIARRHKQLCWKKLRLGKMKVVSFFSVNPCGPL